jgi:superfamily II DNA or RNA helicase
MPLTVADFEGFDLEDARTFLDSFNSGPTRKGEAHYRRGAVQVLTCETPGFAYSATVVGDDVYQVQIYYEDVWDADCTCVAEFGCKHAYAAMKQLLAEYSILMGTGARAVSGKTAPGPAAAVAPAGLAGTLQEKLGRKLTEDEQRYLKTVSQLFRKASSEGLYYHHDLAGLGLRQTDAAYWDRLELYPSPPRSEAEFWNYLALYITDKRGQSIPEFMQPVTDLAKARAAMRQHFRARDIERWNSTLAQLGNPLFQTEPTLTAATATAAELRMRFGTEGLTFEWRLVGDNEWIELKPRKIDAFEVHYAPSLSAEAALLWLPFWQRAKMQYATDFSYRDPWVQEQVGRWLRQPLLRPLLANEAGEPLVFHDAPLRWAVAQPEDADGDYSFSLVQADGQPVPQLRLAARGQPTIYLTVAGAFSGPPFEPCVMPGKAAALIPAPAFESAGGLRLLERLQTPPPPRLAARIRTVPLRPSLRAEVKIPWAGTKTEYCYVDVFGASDDGEQIERWTNNGWVAKNFSEAESKHHAFIRLDRSALGPLIPPLDQAGFKWDFHLQRWQLRVTKKFAEAFVTFLKALPPATRIDLGGELASFQNAEIAGKIRLEASEAELDWFDLRVIVDVNDATLTKEEIKLLLDAKGNWVRLEEKGWRKLAFALSEEEDQELARLGLTPHELTSEPQRLHAFQLADKAARKFLPSETCERIERRATELQSRVTPDLPAAIRAELRPYQRDGFHFLAYLSTNRFGGILADDMGLGKTVQTLAWIAWLRETAALVPDAPPSPPCLVVCPKSVADNWLAEAAKFFPDLKVRVWAASELKSFAGMLASAELHVLNYSQLRLVGEDLARERFHAVILDEGQYIKNPSSQTAQVARQLRSEHRLILSGTPIENRLLDLWSLMSFAMPGALGSRAEFGRLYDSKSDPFARQRLSARVRPFLIRRTKAQVARDLPDRVEEDLFCELEGEQKTLYRAELKRAQAMLLGVQTAAALNKQRFNFLTSLLRLRQICCHTKLVKPDSKAPSAKVEALFETLEPLVEEGEKVLVFSQFVGLLDLLRSEVIARDWPHWYLAGDTEDRGALVAEFQAAEGAGVFLISLKAGGFGLNLTAASYVVLFDPWWNPAVENQAIDRTHRIGQDRKVIAYRLLIKDSIEEKIRALQRQKSSLADDVLGEEKFSQSLSLDDLRYLLEG